MQPETKDGVLEVLLNFNPDAPDIQIPSASLPEQTIREAKTKKADLPGGDGAATAVDAEAAGLPTSS
jgi:hypothetical protein